MHWQWMSGPSVGVLAAMGVLSMANVGDGGVYDEMTRIVNLLVPLVAALLMPCVTAIALLFRTLVAEMRVTREVVAANTAAFQNHTAAFQNHTAAVHELSTGIAGINHRLDDLAERIDRVEMDEGARVPRARRA